MSASMELSSGCLQFAGTPSPIAFEDAQRVAGHLAAIAPSWHAVVPSTLSETAIRVRAAPDGYTLEAPWLAEPFSGLSDVGAACAIFVELSYAFLSQRPDWLCLHAAAVRIAGRLVILAGDYRAGKSTLCLELAAAGACLLADDIVPITPEGHAFALGIAPRLRWPLPPSTSKSTRDFAEAHWGPRDGRYAYVVPPGQEPHGSTVPISAFVVLDRRRDGPAGLSPLASGEALKQILRRNHVYRNASAAVLDRLEATVSGIPCTRLHFSAAAPAAELLMSWLTRWPEHVPLGQEPPGEPLEVSPLDTPQPSVAVDFAVPYQARAGFAARLVGEDLFLTGLTDHAILHFNPLAGAIWRLLRKPMSGEEIVELASTAFPAEARDRIASDVASLLASFVAAGVVEPAQTQIRRG